VNARKGSRITYLHSSSYIPDPKKNFPRDIRSYITPTVERVKLNNEINFLLRKMNFRFGTWNISSLYKVGSLMRVAKEISKYKVDFSGEQ
jgi:hypothetical protein